MAVDLSGLEAAVANNNTVDASAIAVIEGITQQIKDAIAADDLGDSEAINALVASLEASTTSLAAAVSANTEPPTPTP